MGDESINPAHAVQPLDMAGASAYTGFSPSVLRRLVSDGYVRLHGEGDDLYFSQRDLDLLLQGPPSRRKPRQRTDEEQARALHRRRMREVGELARMWTASGLVDDPNGDDPDAEPRPAP
jgi:hypothetical protein